MSLQINETETISRQVNFCWPKPDTRIPESQRKKPAIEGFVDCEYAHYSQEELERFDALVETGELSIVERFQKLVPEIKGLPVSGTETAHAFLVRHKYGAVIRSAIYEDYLLFIAEGRQGNSGKRRSR